MSGPQSQFSLRKGSVEETFRPYEPTKRIKRLYVPENVNDTDRVFSEYDWKNQTYTTTLRSIPQCPPAPRFPHVAAFESTIDPRASGSRSAPEEAEASTSRLRINSRHNPRSIPDETLLSSLLLSSSPLSVADDASGPYKYPSSPIARCSTLSSPLEQSIMANAELDRVHPPSLPSLRSFKQLQEDRPRRVSFARRPRSDSRKTMVNEDLPCTSSPQNVATYRRNRSYTWSSDVTAVEVSESVDKSFGCESDCDEIDDEDEVPETQSSESLETRGEAFRRRSLSFWRRRPSMRSYPQDFGEDDVDESQSAEEDIEEEEPRKETRVNHIISAIHYRYVSVGLRVQLAVHRTEKKVVRKLSNRRKN